MPIEDPCISWQNELPFSETFHDIYFSREDGLEESRYVFLNGNQLPQRWEASDNTPFTILETGFGTGLNFVLTSESFLNNAPAQKVLHYISIEKFPLKKEDLQKSLIYFAEKDNDAVAGFLPQMIKQLGELYPYRLGGFHRLDFAGARILLTLVFGDISDMLDSIVAPNGIDAFYLDGFNPATNQEMWSGELFSRIYKISSNYSTLATFTSAGHVRRNIEKAGFEVRKIPGFGKKREMITAQLIRKPEKVPHNKPWFFAPSRQNINIAPKKVAIIGAGLAGCALASAFARRGWYVELIDRNPEICAEASGNPLGIFFPVVHRKPTFTDRLSLAAYLYLLQRLKALRAGGLEELIGARQNGLLQILPENEKTGRFGDYLALHGGLDSFFEQLDESAIKKTVGIKSSGGIFYREAGYLHPKGLSLANLSEASIKGEISLRTSCEIDSIQYENDRWNLQNKDGALVVQADVVVLANSNDIKKISQASLLPVQKIRGQLIQLKNVRALPYPVSASVYMISTGEDAIIGATHEFSDDSRVDEKQSRKLLDDAGALFGGGQIFNGKEDSLTARVSFRAAAVDHFPVIGAIPNTESYNEIFADLVHGDTHYIRRHGEISRPEAWHPDLFCLAGLGSRGILYSQLGAEIVASLACGEPAPVERDILEALSPARFLYRKLKKGHS